MGRNDAGEAVRQVRRLYESGSMAGRSDAELLDRFARERDGAAFEALVERHGPLVMGLCRAITHDDHAADDAFQAVFLVLARRAGSIRVDGSLARWLYGVARRVARRIESRTPRKTVPLDEVFSPPLSDPDTDHLERAELIEALHDEIARLPQTYREPILLCCFEGRTHAEAAQLLHRPIGTIKGHLARARERLRLRLIRRGWAPAAVAAACAAGGESLAASVPVALSRSTVRVALAFVGPGYASALRATSILLAEGVLKTMTMNHLRFAAASVAVVLAGSLGLGGAVLWASDAPGRRGSHHVVETPVSRKSTTGVPVLQDIPFIEHLFTHVDKSVPGEPGDRTENKSEKLVMQDRIDALIVDRFGSHSELGDLVAANNRDEAAGRYLQLQGRVAEARRRLRSLETRMKRTRSLYEALGGEADELAWIDQLFEAIGGMTAQVWVVADGGRALNTWGAPVQAGHEIELEFPAPPVDVARRPIPGLSGRHPVAKDGTITLGDAGNCGVAGLPPSSVRDTVAAFLIERFVRKNGVDVKPAGSPAASGDIEVEVWGPAPGLGDDTSRTPPGERVKPGDRFHIRVSGEAPARSRIPNPDEPSRISITPRYSGTYTVIGIGTVRVGAAGDFHVSGLTPEAARREVLEALKGRIRRGEAVEHRKTSTTGSETPGPLVGGPNKTFKPYVVEPPDVLRIEVHADIPNLAGEYLVRPDGTIVLAYGTLDVHGRTVDEIKTLILEHVAKHHGDDVAGLRVAATDKQGERRIEPKASTSITVDVSAFNSKFYYVQGLVQSPGRLPITGSETVLDAINQAGGLMAEARTVKLIRPAPKPGLPASTLFVDYEAIVHRGDVTTNYDILPGDRIIAYGDVRVSTPADELPATTATPKNSSPQLPRPSSRANPAPDPRILELQRKLDELQKELKNLRADPTSSTRPAPVEDAPQTRSSDASAFTRWLGSFW